MENTSTNSSKRPSRLFGRYIVRSGFQFKFSFVVFLCLAGVAFFVWLQGNMVVKNMIETGAVNGEEAIAQLNLLNSMIANTCIMGLAITFGLALFFSHFVAGPIYRFQQIMEEMKLGKLTMRVQVRKHDEFQDVADTFTQAIASLRVKLREERAAVSAQADKIGELAAALKQKGLHAEADQLAAMLTDLKHLPAKIQI